MITPDVLAKTGSEHGIQAGLFAWANIAKIIGFGPAFAWAEGRTTPEYLRSLFEANKDAPALPDLEWLHAIPNGGSRGDTDQSRKIRGATMKAEGVRDGVADIFWPVARFPYHGLYIEMKTPTGDIRPSQKDFKRFALAQGYAFSFERSWHTAARLIQSYYVGNSNVALNLKEK